MYDVGTAKKITECREAIKRHETEIEVLEGLREDVLTGRCRIQDIYPYCKYSSKRFDENIQYKIRIHRSQINCLTRKLGELYKQRSWLDVEYYHPMDVMEIKEHIEHDGYVIGIVIA